MTTTTLYRFYDAEGGLLYVGISLSALQRFSQHRLDKSWWANIASSRLEHFLTRRAAAEAELAAIKNEKPRHNIAGQTRQILIPRCRRPEPPVLTFSELAEVVPQLARLEQEARAVQSFPGFCANNVWFGYGTPNGGFKEVVSRLVGWGSFGQPPWLKSREAYDVAYDHLYALLPDCRWVDDRRNRCMCA